MATCQFFEFSGFYPTKRKPRCMKTSWNIQQNLIHFVSFLNRNIILIGIGSMEFWRALFVPWQCAVVFLSLGCMLSWVGWGRLVAIVACRSGLYLGRSLSESYKHSKWLFRRTSWCLVASPYPRLIVIVWELKCLKWLFSSAIVVTGKSWQAHGDTQCSVVLWITVHFKVHKSNPTSQRCVLGTQWILSLGG